MEINITALRAENLYAFFHSRAEGGKHAARNSWRAAMDDAKTRRPPLLSTPEELDAFRDHIRGFGAWEAEEIEDWTSEECNALFIQLIAGDVREAGADSLDDIDWDQYQEDAEAGRVAGNFYRGEDCSVLYYLGS